MSAPAPRNPKRPYRCEVCGATFRTPGPAVDCEERDYAQNEDRMAGVTE